MASPIIKIKRGNTKPGSYTINGSNQTGLTAGEMGVMIDSANSRYAFYIGNNVGEAITYGCEITTDTAWTTTSDYKIPTQSAIKSYIASLGSPSGGSTAIISRYHQRSTDGTITINAATTSNVLFGATDFSVGTIPLSYASGVFTNTSATETLTLLITYQITWDILTQATTYNTTDAVRSAWIQKSGTPVDQNVFGFNSLIVPPQASTSSGAVSGTQNSSSVIRLAPGFTFAIQARNHGTLSRNIAETSQVNNTGLVTNFTRATNIQIARI